MRWRVRVRNIAEGEGKSDNDEGAEGAEDGEDGEGGEVEGWAGGWGGGHKGSSSMVQEKRW